MKKKEKRSKYEGGQNNGHYNTTQDDPILEPISTSPPLLPSFSVADVKSIRFALDSVNIKTTLSTHAEAFSTKNNVKTNSFSTDSEQVSELLFDFIPNEIPRSL